MAKCGCCVAIVLPLIYFGYIVLGGVAFHYLEKADKTHNHSAKVHKIYEDFIERSNCDNDTDLAQFAQEIITAYNEGFIDDKGKAIEETEEVWTFHKSVYFATTVVSTIGYGNIAPVTTGGRVFTVAFAVIGIPLALVVYGKVGSRLDNTIATITGKCTKDKTSRKNKYLRALLNILGGITLFLLLPAIGFKFSEDWTYLEAVYYGFITLTTIGFGDFVAGFDDERRIFYYWCLSLWIMFGLAWMSSLISNLHDIITHKVEDTLTRVSSKGVMNGVSRQNGYHNDSAYDKTDDSCTVDAIVKPSKQADSDFTAF